MRVPLKALNKYPCLLRLFFWNQKRRYGAILQPALLWARVPKLFVTVALLYGALDRKKSPLDPILRSLITVRVSQINCCAFCIDINSYTLAKRSKSTRKLDELTQWKQSEAYSDEERISLEYAEAMTFSDRQVSDELMSKLKHFFDENSLVELTGLIAFQNMSSKFNSALDVSQQGFCALINKK